MSDSIMHPTAEKLQGFVEGLLDASDRVVLESHLLGCAECQSEVEEWRSLFSVLATLPQHEPSPAFVNRVMAHVTLPDPWYVTVPARVVARVERYAPKTTRGWATATAFLGLPIVLFGALVAYFAISKPYFTPSGMVAFVYERSAIFLNQTTQNTVATILQSDIALFAARGLAAIANAGAGAAGALLLALSTATALSAWVLYQNVIRKTTRENHNYVSYSF
jgi:hypothetical protein